MRDLRSLPTEGYVFIGRWLSTGEGGIPSPVQGLSGQALSEEEFTPGPVLGWRGGPLDKNWGYPPGQN